MAHNAPFCVSSTPSGHGAGPSDPPHNGPGHPNDPSIHLDQDTSHEPRTTARAKCRQLTINNYHAEQRAFSMSPHTTMDMMSPQMNFSQQPHPHSVNQAQDGIPAQQYGQQYGQPGQQYAQPSQQYARHAQQYAQPSQQYAQPGQSYAQALIGQDSNTAYPAQKSANSQAPSQYPPGQLTLPPSDGVPYNVTAYRQYQQAGLLSHYHPLTPKYKSSAMYGQSKYSRSPQNPIMFDDSAAPPPAYDYVQNQAGMPAFQTPFSRYLAAHRPQLQTTGEGENTMQTTDHHTQPSADSLQAPKVNRRKGKRTLAKAVPNVKTIQ
jgi:hypothetical protein